MDLEKLSKELERNHKILMNPNFWDKYPEKLRKLELDKREALSEMFFEKLDIYEAYGNNRFYLNGKDITDIIWQCKKCKEYCFIINIYLESFTSGNIGISRKDYVCLKECKKNKQKGKFIFI